MNSIKKAQLNNTICNKEINENRFWGVGNTPLNNEINEKFKVKIGFDYLTFTIPFDESNTYDFEKLNEICKMFKLDDNLKECHLRGFYGYRKMFSWQNQVNSHSISSTKFLYDSPVCNSNRIDEENVVHLLKTGCFEFSGDCCRDLERRYNKEMPSKWFDIFDSLIFTYRAKISRFDLCIDLFDCPFTIQEIYEAYEHNLLLTPLHKFTSHITESSNGIYDEYSLYLGSMGADVCINIYDKKIERESINLFVDCENWYRIEFRFRHEKAQNIVLNLLKEFHDNNSISDYVSKLVLSYIDIKCIPDKSKFNYKDLDISISKNTMRNWPSNEKWINIIGSTSKAKVINFYKYESSITRNANWIQSSVAKTLAKLYLTNKEYFYTFIKMGVHDGLERIESKDLKIINDFLESHGLEKIYSSDLIHQSAELNELIVDELKHMNPGLELTGEVMNPYVSRDDLYDERIKEL